MSQVPIRNTGSTDIFIGGICIPAGETRIFESTDLPPHLLPDRVKTAQAPADPIQELLAKPAKQILPALQDLDVPQLNALRAAEEERGKPRTTVLGAIDELLLERATRQEEQEHIAAQAVGEAIGGALGYSEPLKDEQ